MKYYLRTGNFPSDKKIFVDCGDYYDGIVFPVNILAYFFNAIKFSLEETKKPFFIDPITAIFQKNPDSLKREVLENSVPSMEFKKSVGTYFQYLGETARTLLSDKNFNPSSFNVTNFDQFIKDILDYQNEIFKKQDDRSQTLDAYFDFLDGSEEKKEEISPFFLVAPYFFFTGIDDQWYSINQKIAKNLKKENYIDKPIFGVICTDISTICDEKLNSQIIADFSNFDGFLIFLNNFDEYSASEEQLSAFLKFISALKKLNKPIINMYGEYFSQVLQYFGLDGFCTGVGILEKKNIFAQKSEGYGQHKKIYVDALHRLIKEDESKFLAVIKPLDEGNKSPYCSKIEEIIKTSKTRRAGVDSAWNLNNMNYELLYPDFLLRKKLETDEIEVKTLKEIISLLIKDSEEAEALPIPENKKGHLSRWIKVLSDNLD